MTPEKLLALFPGRTDCYGFAPTKGKCLTKRGQLTVVQAKAHLAGTVRIGRHLLLPDGTCHAVVIDSDDQGGSPVLEICALLTRDRLRFAVERSKSKGWHVWIFFAAPVPAWKARAVAQAIVSEAGWSRTEVFPKQSALGEDGVGNYIFLPWHGESMKDQRTVFVDLSKEQWPPFPDQAAYLESIQQTAVTETELDAIIAAKGLRPPEERTASSGNGKDPAPPVGDQIPEGQRNATLTSLAGSMRRRGMSEEAILAALLIENQKCDPPLSETELRAIAQSIGKYEPTANPTHRASQEPPAAETPEVRREGFDLIAEWPDTAQFRFAAIRDGREGVRGELTVRWGDRRVHWGAMVLSSGSGREALRKKLEGTVPGPPWGAYLEEAAYHLAQASRQGEPLITLTGVVSSPTRELVPRLLYEGEPTLIYGDGDTGKSLLAAALAAAVRAGVALPFGLKPACSTAVAYLDWETSADTLNARLALLAAGWKIPVPEIIYKRMTRPLVDESATLAAEFARRNVGFVVVDSMMFAVVTGETSAYHEAITTFYRALRLFAPAATLVVSHVTGEDARRGGAARPFGGAFAYNGPRLILEAKRDRDLPGTAIVLTCTKANNLPRRPDPVGLLFRDGGDAMTVSALDLRDAAPEVTASASLTYRIELALARGIQDPDAIAKELEAKLETVKRLLRRIRAKPGGPT